MKRLISPPIQLFLWLGGIGCLCVAGWNVWQLRQLSVETHMAQSSVKVEIPDARALSVPGIGRYRQLVSAPLFWEERAVPRPTPKPVPVVATKIEEPEVIEVELEPPIGRLVGIVDLGDKIYALVRNGEENQSLNKGDTWEGWKVDKISKNKLVLKAGNQRTEVALIGDFAAPQLNKQLLAAGQRKAQRQKQARRQKQLRRQQQQRQQQQVNQRQQALQAANLPGTSESAGQSAVEQLAEALVQSKQENETAAPVMSIKEALEARQRLMASRWGSRKPKK